MQSRLRKWQKMFPSIRTVTFCSARTKEITFFSGVAWRTLKREYYLNSMGEQMLKPYSATSNNITYCLYELLVFVELSASVFTSFQKMWKDSFSRPCRLIKTSDDRRETPHPCSLCQPLTSSRSHFQILNSLIQLNASINFRDSHPAPF